MDLARHRELARLDALQAAHWAAATSGTDLKAADLCIKVIALRTKLLGIDGPPPSTEGVGRTIVISGTSEEYSRQLREIALAG